MDWDEEFQGELRREWDDWITSLAGAKKIMVDKCIYENPREEVLEYQLHGFGDTSTKAYCAVVYLVYRTRARVHAKLLAAKTCVAPLKALTIPRLELMSERILAQLMDTIKKAFKSEIEVSGARCWLDSKTAICWIQNRGEWRQFVQHRVNEILKLTKKGDWGHCPGKENPADLGYRGVLVTKAQG